MTVVCGKPHIQAGTKDVVDNPTIVVEVLSPTSEQYDRGLKWESYRQVASLTDYLLVSQKTAVIEHFGRESDGAWRYRATGRGARVKLTQGAELDVDAIYENVFELSGD